MSTFLFTKRLRPILHYFHRSTFSFSSNYLRYIWTPDPVNKCLRIHFIIHLFHLIFQHNCSSPTFACSTPPNQPFLLVTDFGCSIFSFCKNSKFSLKPTGTHDDGCRFQGWMREQAAGKAGGLLDDSFLWGAVARGHFVLLLPLGKSRTAHHRRRRKTELWPVSGKSCSTR